jgi:glycine cleavage system pyridoxal-binding protein P
MAPNKSCPIRLKCTTGIVITTFAFLAHLHAAAKVHVGCEGVRELAQQVAAAPAEVDAQARLCRTSACSQQHEKATQPKHVLLCYGVWYHGHAQ